MISKINLAESLCLLDKLPNNLFSEIVNKTKQFDFDAHNSYNNNLIGHISREYVFPYYKKELEDFVLNLIYYHQQNNSYLDELQILKRSCELYLDDVWINFQTKYEFNPPHSHSGVYSFVLWVNIPYDIKTELQQYNVRGKSQNSTFNFLYTNGTGRIKNHTIYVDKTYEGYLCLFPSNTMHSVNPFYTSDDYRISISGNIKLDNERFIPN